MQVSELVRATSVPLATVKYYLREGLLPAARKLHRPLQRVRRGARPPV